MKKTLIGTVQSNAMDKTLIVSVEGTVTHRIYKKQIKKTKRYYVHDEDNQGSVGDIVEIQESRPRSKNKRWELVKIVKE
jgi:small subunit ribosomal protein S17